MIVQPCRVTTDENGHERQPHATEGFPCTGYRTRYSEASGDAVPWHWHEDFELVRVTSGRMRFAVPEREFSLREGDVLFINSSALHAATPIGYCDLDTVVFHPSLVGGEPGSVFSTRYVMPLVRRAALAAWPASGLGARDGSLAEWFAEAFEAMDSEPSGYEFTVRDRLSRACHAIYAAHASEYSSSSDGRGRDTERMKAMLAFIHGAYAEELSLADIAASASIGERECLRCFRRTLRTSPVRYLIEYRLSRAAALLLHEPGLSVTEVAARTGFDSPSNFAATFRRRFKATPREYRAS